MPYEIVGTRIAAAAVIEPICVCVCVYMHMNCIRAHTRTCSAKKDVNIMQTYATERA